MKVFWIPVFFLTRTSSRKKRNDVCWRLNSCLRGENRACDVVPVCIFCGLGAIGRESGYQTPARDTRSRCSIVLLSRTGSSVRFRNKLFQTARRQKEILSLPFICAAVPRRVLPRSFRYGQCAFPRPCLALGPIVPAVRRALKRRRYGGSPVTRKAPRSRLPNW